MKTIKIVILICCIVLLCGCSINTKKCIKSHQEIRTCFRPMCVFMGKNPICIPQSYPCTQTICDEYEVEE